VDCCFSDLALQNPTKHVEYLKDAKNMPEPEPDDGNGGDEHECIEE
jgi:hypothetical protein